MGRYFGTVFEKQNHTAGNLLHIFPQTKFCKSFWDIIWNSFWKSIHIISKNRIIRPEIFFVFFRKQASHFTNRLAKILKETKHDSSYFVWIFLVKICANEYHTDLTCSKILGCSKSWKYVKIIKNGKNIYNNIVTKSKFIKRMGYNMYKKRYMNNN